MTPFDPGILPPIVAPHAIVGGKGSLQQRFEAFHLANPHVFELVLNIARDLRARGMKRCGVKLIVERLRWLYALQTRGDTFKINNDWAPYYARVAVLVDPALDGFFMYRKQTVAFVPDLEALGLDNRPPAEE